MAVPKEWVPIFSHIMPADHAVALLLIELPRLFQALRAHVFLEGNNVTRPVT